MYIMDRHIKVLHFDKKNKKIYSCPLNEINKDEVINVNKHSSDFNYDYKFIHNKETIFEVDVSTTVFDEVKFYYNLNTFGYSLCDKNGKYLCADTTDYSFSRDQCNLWETFSLIDDDFIQKIYYIKTNCWLSKRDEQLYYPKDISLSDNFCINIGPYSINLLAITKDDINQYQIVTVCDGWKPEIFLLYKPLIYITAYSDKDVLNQLGLCIKSIRKFGNFYAKIIVMTDQSLDTIKKICGDYHNCEIEIDKNFPEDFVGYVCSKFNIIDREIYKGYQPLMYLDPDIIFDSPIEPMLLKSLATGNICAPLETFHHLKTHPPVGAGLIQLDGMEVSPYAAGFNGGTLIFPNVEDQNVRQAVHLIRRTITHLGIKFGRTFNKWADQEVLNYISYKYGFINTAVLTKYAKFIDNDPLVKFGCRGFVHFWGTSKDNKVRKMEQYLNKLKQIH